MTYQEWWPMVTDGKRKPRRHAWGWWRWRWWWYDSAYFYYCCSLFGPHLRTSFEKFKVSSRFLICTEIKTEIWIIFSSFIRSVCVLPQEKTFNHGYFFCLSFINIWTTLLYAYVQMNLLLASEMFLKALANSNISTFYTFSGNLSFAIVSYYCYFYTSLSTLIY